MHPDNPQDTPPSPEPSDGQDEGSLDPATGQPPGIVNPPEGQMDQPWAPQPSQSGGRSHKTLWIAGGIAAAVAAALVVVLIVTNTGTSSVSEPSRTSDITDLSESMLVDASSFPQGLKVSGPVIRHNLAATPIQYLPAECRPLEDVPVVNQLASREASAPHGKYVDLLRLSSEKLDFQSIVGECKTYGIYFPHHNAIVMNVRTLHLSGVPSWAIAYGTTDAVPGAAGPTTDGSMRNEHVDITGYYRGVLVSVWEDADTNTDALVKLFNDQVAKLAAA
jgi:hypothetical protein